MTGRGQDGTEGFATVSLPVSCKYIACSVSNVLGDVGGVVYEGSFVVSCNNNEIVLSAHSRADGSVTMGINAYIICFI